MVCLLVLSQRPGRRITQSIGDISAQYRWFLADVKSQPLRAQLGIKSREPLQAALVLDPIFIDKIFHITARQRSIAEQPPRQSALAQPRAAEFAAVMQRTRRARLRQGALSWGLFRDASLPGRYVEYFVDENWVEHQRRLERFTAFDAELRTQRLAFHVGSEAPVLRRYVADGLSDSSARPL